MNSQHQFQEFMRQVTTPTNQLGTTQNQPSITITRDSLEKLLQFSLINQANSNTDNKIEDTRERLIKLETQVEQIQKDITDIKNDKKFNITTFLTIISIVVACVAAYFSYQATQPKEVPLQSSELSHMTK